MQIGTLGIVSWTGFNPERLGVPKSKLPEIETWDKTAFGKIYGYPNVFYTLNEARKYVQNFITERYVSSILQLWVFLRVLAMFLPFVYP